MISFFTLKTVCNLLEDKRDTQTYLFNKINNYHSEKNGTLLKITIMCSDHTNVIV
ncbi:hypothetical protein QE382_004000 [Sphingobacterium zeae]|uniref:Uncharacterized protein n=1 Tax=Sphingobacterium zeae TaxID=1776859 RepID=A0ABU0UAW7_9SPHI|nr:hypothetical protein [Sphingobacterium zeae]